MSEIRAMPLSKELFDRAVKLGVAKIALNFAGGSDEGYLDVSCWDKDGNLTKDSMELASDIDQWAWQVYKYNGAGDGNDYGDDIVYDLENKKVTVSDWFMAREEGASEETTLEVAEAEDDG